jgi:hypothetical protein
MSQTIEMKQRKARNMRHKKAALATLNYDSITDELYALSEECDGIRYLMADDEMLLNALDGDEDDAYEFRMMFSDLSAKCESLDYALRDTDVTEHFNDFLVGILGNKYNAVGYDSYEEDYFNLTRFEGELAQSESGKRIMRLTKEQMLSVCGQCIGIVVSFLDIRHKYEYLKATFDILKDQSTSILRTVKDIEALYEQAMEDGPGSYSMELLDKYISNLPDDVWLMT